MKKYLFALLAVMSAASAGCDTTVASDEVSSMLSEENRCLLTNGLPFTTKQANVIKSMLDTLNNSDCWGGSGIVGQSTFTLDENNIKCVSFPALDRAASELGVSKTALKAKLTEIKTRVGGLHIAYNSQPMALLYEYVKLNVLDEADSSSKTYCSCGYEFCDLGSECTVDQVTKLPICSFSTSDVLKADESCAPVLISDTALANFISTTIYPLMWKVSDLKGKVVNHIIEPGHIQVPCASQQKAKANESLCRNSKDGFGEPSYLLKKDCSLLGDNQSIAKCSQAVMMFGFITNCVNPTHNVQIDGGTIDIKKIKEQSTRTCPDGYELRYQCGDFDKGMAVVSTEDGGNVLCENKVQPSFVCYDKADDKSIPATLVEVESFSNAEKKFVEYANKNLNINQVFVDKAYYRGTASAPTFYPVCYGDVIVAGNNMNSGSVFGYEYFQQFREITEEIIKIGYNENNPDDKRILDALNWDVEGNSDYTYLDQAVDEFLISHMYEIFWNSDKFMNNPTIVAGLASNVIVSSKGTCNRDKEFPGYCEGACVGEGNNVECDNDRPGIEYWNNSTILNTMKEYYKITYLDKESIKINMKCSSSNNQGGTDKDKPTCTEGESVTYESKFTKQKLHYFFYEYLASLINPTPTILNGSFSMNLDCVTPASGIGDPAGMKKYCSANSSLPITIHDILNAIETSKLERLKFAYALISQDSAVEEDLSFDVVVDNKVEGGKDTYTVFIDPNAADSKKISFKKKNDRNSKVEYFSGTWMAMRCPSGASCIRETKQCGVCADTSIPQTLYELSSDGESYIKYENATCSNGQIVK